RQRHRRADDAPAPEGRCRRQPALDPHGSRCRVCSGGARTVTPWWSTTSIRVRLTGWYSLVLFLMLVAYATATFFAVRHEFYEQFDDQLHEDAETAQAFLAATSDGRVAWSGARVHDANDDEDRGSEIWSATGEEIYRSGATGA